MNQKNEYFCTNCGTSLSNQKGFLPNTKIWKCKNCGQKLYNHEPDAEDVTWYCDNCHSELSLQEGFSSKLDCWACKICGYKNMITPEFIYDSVYDYEDHIVYDEIRRMYLPLPKKRITEER